jgi:hypothetical protein
MKNAHSLLVLVAFGLAACGGSGGDAPESTPEAAPPAAVSGGATVTIVEPQDGATVMGPHVTVRLAVTGVSIVPAGDMTPGTGHHHLYLDADLAPMSEPVPTVPGSIVHLGNAASEFTFENVAPGQHRLIAVVADGAHVPLDPPVMDTVVFTVR